MMAALRRHPFALIFLLALLLRVGYLIDIYDTPISLWHAWKQSDMDTFLTTARQIQDQGLLLPRPHHPYHMVHAATGSAKRWERWFGGEHAYYRVPGYYYFLALVLALSKGSILAVKIVHVLLGAGHATLLALIGTRMMGLRTGIIVGLLAAIYGPFIAAEEMILREALGLFLAAAGLYLTLCAVQPATESSTRRQKIPWLWAGIVLGIGAVIKETGGILFASIWVWTILRSFRRRDYDPWLAPLSLLCGFLLPFIPFVVRNVLVGAPLLGSSALFVWAFAAANAVDSSTHGVILEISASVSTVMGQADARPLDVIRLTWQNYDGWHAQFFINWWIRFSALWSNVEIPDNSSYDFLVLHSPLLASLPRFVCIWLPAALALGVLGRQWIGGQIRRLRTASPSTATAASWVCFAPGTLSLILILLALHILLMSLTTYPLGRYRLLIVPFLILLAGWTVSSAICAARRHHVRQVAGLSLALVLLSVIWWVWPAIPAAQAFAIRATDFSLASALLIRQGSDAGARHELREGFRYCDQISPGPEQFGEKCRQELTSVQKELFGEAEATPPPEARQHR